jgi:glycosyltransferase involved in cell wall biosynthesis
MLISVVIPTYNRQDTISRSIQSALEQTYSPIEVIVVDDGSTDATDQILRQFGGNINVLRQPNGGPSAARNKGILAAKGSAIAFLDSDDTWLPDKIMRQAELLSRGGDIVPCCVSNALLEPALDGHRTSFGIASIKGPVEDGFWMNPAFILATRFLLFNQVVLVRREALDKVGGFDNGLRLLEDYDLALRLSLLGPWGIVSEPLVVKDNSTRGLGVEAMAATNQGPLIEVNAQLLEKVLEKNLTRGTRLYALIQRQVKILNAQKKALQLRNSGSTLRAAVANVLLLKQRIYRALWRRSPWWPKPVFSTNVVDRKQWDRYGISR